MASRSKRLPAEKSEIEYLILADAVEVLNGKLYMMGGGWDSISAGSIESAVQISFACGVSVAWGERDDEHSLQLSVVDLDGTPVETPLVAGFKTGSSPLAERGSFGHVPFAVKGSFTFPKHATYSIVAELDGRPDSVRKLQFHLRPPGSGPR
jgi:hypothetical protein